MRELQAREAARPRPEPESEPARPREQQQGLEKVRQQLLCAAGLLTSFINQTVDRQVSRDCPGHMPSTFDVGKNSEWGVSLISGSGFHETHSISHPTCVDELVGSILLKDDDSIVVFAFSCDRKSRCLSDQVSLCPFSIAHHPEGLAQGQHPSHLSPPRQGWCPVSVRRLPRLTPWPAAHGARMRPPGRGPTTLLFGGNQC